MVTKRSLYLLVLDARRGEQESRIEYWLRLIRSFGGSSPIIVVCNKSDEHQLELDWTGLQKKYPSIKGFIKRLSCKTGEGISELTNVIKHEVGQLEHINDPLLVSWFAVKARLEEMEENFISYEYYQRLCETENITDETSQRTLIGFLNDLGIILHFRDHPILEDTNVLNPEWVTKGVYQILNSYELSQNKGVLERKTLSNILDSKLYPRNKHLFIIDMMRKFELCFDFEGKTNEKFLIPDLLQKDEPDTGDWSNSLAFEYHYDVLPSSVISRFIVRMHPFISRSTYWRNGVVLVSDNNKNRALVKADSEDRKIFVKIAGQKHTQRQFLEIIRVEFRAIHETIPDIRAKQKVPLPDHPGVVVDYEHLLNLEALGEETFVPEGLLEKINVKQLLNGIEIRSFTQEKQLPKIDSKISDFKRLEILYNNLSQLQEQKALHGPVDIPLKLINEIRLTMTEIAELEEKLNFA